MEENKEFKTVAQFSDPLRAGIVAGMLNENGIPAAVFGADTSYPSLSYVREVEVKVNEADYEAAMSLLAASDSAE